MAETRWLGASEQVAWRAYLESSLLVFDALDRQLQREAGMTHGYYQILVRLSEAPGCELRMSELAEATQSSRSRLSHAVARLEERGWVARSTCETDRRGQVARLTDAGYRALEAAAPGHVAEVRRVLIDRLTPSQVHQLGEIAQIMVDALADPMSPVRRSPGELADTSGLPPQPRVAIAG